MISLGKHYLVVWHDQVVTME
ncbi:unnamed protein product, partial [Rotaria sp. Silwood1]